MIKPYPTFYVDDAVRDEATSVITITAYDILQEAAKHTVAEIGLSEYTLLEFAAACASIIGATGVSLVGLEETDSLLQLHYPQGANFEGTETLRQALTALAEVAQVVIYLDSNNNLTLKRLNKRNVVERFTLSDYFTHVSKGSKRIDGVAHITELGDNIEATNGTNTGFTFYIRNNPFLELRNDVAEILQNAADRFKSVSFPLYELNARGNYLLEIGDCYSIEGKEGVTAVFLLNDSIRYNGGLSQKLWYIFNDSPQTATNPTTIGEALNQTTARVDKVNREIELLVTEESITEKRVTALEIASGNITAKVENIETANETLNGTLTELTQKVEATVTHEQVKLEIETQLANGANKVETATGYTFNENGLTVSKSNSEMQTTITDDGMTVYKDNNPVLVADNEGVKAIDLHAETYLIIGKNSRLEDYGKRTACFWIGGSN